MTQRWPRPIWEETDPVGQWTPAIQRRRDRERRRLQRIARIEQHH